MEKKKVLCIIPARGGSKRIPYKNISLFKGVPIISYSIKTVLDSGIADEIMVSTDDEKIAEIAKQYGAKVPFFRDESTSNDFAGVADVLVEVVNKYKEIGQEFEYVICVFATDPLLRSENLSDAFSQLERTPDAESISTAEEYSFPPQRGLIIEEGILKMLHPENYSCRSQDFQKIYHDSNQFFIYRTEALLRYKKLYTNKNLPFIIKSSESQDIDTMEDWVIAEMKYDLIHNSES